LNNARREIPAAAAASLNKQPSASLSKITMPLQSKFNTMEREYPKSGFPSITCAAVGVDGGNWENRHENCDDAEKICGVFSLGVQSAL